MEKIEIDKLEQRLKKATSWWYFFSKFMDITLGRIKYTNDDIDELIEYYEKKEQYKLCEKLMVLKK
jgi:hypothetical protein